MLYFPLKQNFLFLTTYISFSDSENLSMAPTGFLKTIWLAPN